MTGVFLKPYEKPNHTFVINVDNTATPLQKQQITKATAAWEEASSHIVHFKLVWDQKKPQDIIHEMSEQSRDGIFIWNLTEKQRRFTSNSEETHGYFFPIKKSAFIITFPESFSKEHYYQVVIHELGHMLGLNHSENKNSIMNQSGTTWSISKEDTENLCKIYGCESL